MVRKQVKATNGKPSASPPYPVSPGPANVQNNEAAEYAPQNSGLRDTMVAFHNDPTNGHDSNDVWADLADSKANNEFSAGSRMAEGRLDERVRTRTEKRDDILPPSLQVGPAVMTPRSSFDSQRSIDCNTKLEIPMDPSHDVQTSYTQSLPSNNPWASASHSPSRKIKAPATISASNGILESQPFAEPWVDFADPPVQHAPFIPDAIPHPFTKEGDTPLDPYSDRRRGDSEIGNQPSSHRETPTPLADQISELHELESGSPWGASDVENGLPKLPPRNEDLTPELPPRQVVADSDIPPARPPRPLLNLKVENFRTPSETSGVDQNAENPFTPAGSKSTEPSADTQSRATTQRNETYQIRLVNWFDASSPNGIRSSPIMVQNANGPCPLLALVNALTLSTPAHMSTALVETLRVREQVSLGLLLDAVIDELMSGRRGHNLPDVTDLYAFLINLHTGMNVNPCFIQSEAEGTSLLDAPIVESPKTSGDFRKPGGFEDTREMRLYSTFGMTLIHGWIPPRNHPAFAALNRSSKTYEDAQNLMFREEELEDKLRQHGLNKDEQIMLEDISTVKYFLSSSATQLTGYGLDIMTEALGPGSIAILFRNDHFSTLYKHPQSGQLFTLVTDMGYSGHDEVVWESLVDVSGEGCEFFAGDFRPVGNGAEHSSKKAPSSDGAGWTTVPKSKANHNKTLKLTPSDDQSSHTPSQQFSLLTLHDETPQSPGNEQEDHDLALALQLQEEEEELHRRRAIARRREEDELSQAFLASQTPSPASRRGAGRGTTRGQEIRPLIPPRGGEAARAQRKAVLEDDEDAPPPTYEQAAKGPAYHPPPDNPAYTQTPSSPNSNTRRPQANGPRHNAYVQNSAALGGSPSTHRGSVPTLATSPVVRGGSRRRSYAARYPGQGRGSSGAGGVSTVEQGEDDRKECVVM